MGWGSGRKRFLLRFALRPRSGARHKVSTHLRSGSLVTSLSFLRCAARLARGGLFFHFPKHRRKKHRCNDMSTMQYMRLHCASNSLGASHGAVLCKPRTPGASAHMQTKAGHQYEHMKCTIRPFQSVAEYFAIWGEIEADIPDASQRPRRSVLRIYSKASLQTRSTGCTVFRRPHTPSMNKYKRLTAASHF